MAPPASNSLRSRAWNLYAAGRQGHNDDDDVSPCLCPGFWQFSVASNAHPVCLNLGVGRGKNKDCAPLHGADGRAAYGR
jgi:hypothetical protein